MLHIQDTTTGGETVARKLATQVLFEQATLDALDEVRGAEARSSYIRRLVEKHLAAKAKKGK